LRIESETQCGSFSTLRRTGFLGMKPVSRVEATQQTKSTASRENGFLQRVIILLWAIVAIAVHAWRTARFPIAGGKSPRTTFAGPGPLGTRSADRVRKTRVTCGVCVPSTRSRGVCWPTSGRQARDCPARTGSRTTREVVKPREEGRSSGASRSGQCRAEALEPLGARDSSSSRGLSSKGRRGAPWLTPISRASSA